MKSEGYTEQVLPFTALEKLTLPLIAHYGKRASLHTWERWTPSLTKGEEEPTPTHSCRGADSVTAPKVHDPSGSILSDCLTSGPQLGTELTYSNI